MDSFANYYYMTVQASASIDGKDVPISWFEVHYALDNIPYAIIAFPIGRQMMGGSLDQPSSAEDLLSSLDPFTPVELFVNITSIPGGRSAPPGKNKGFKEGSTRVFTGFFMAPKYHKKALGQGNVELIAEAVGFPVALAAGTQYTIGAVTTESQTGTNTGLQLYGRFPAGPTVEATISEHASSIKDDIWEVGIKENLVALLADQSAFSGHIRTNQFAQQAFDRINTGIVLPNIPLRMNVSLDGGTQDLMDRALVGTIFHTIYPAEGDLSSPADFWSIIMSLKDRFFYHFVPAIEEDSIAPLLGNLGGDPYLIVDPSEYFKISTQRAYDPEHYSMINSVGLFAYNLHCTPWQAKTVPSGIVGAYEIQLPEGKEGRTILRPAPEWVSPPYATGKNSLNPGNGIPDKGNPSGGIAPINPHGDMERTYLGKDFGSIVAHLTICEELFRHRTMSLTGRFRLDVAPGSTIQVNSAGEAFTGKQSTLFGMVDAVSLSAGNQGDGGFAHTTLSLSHVRTNNEQGVLTEEQHPLYTDVWVGGPLTEV